MDDPLPRLAQLHECRLGLVAGTGQGRGGHRVTGGLGGRPGKAQLYVSARSRC